jgi:DNA-binding beta-propeller fold protein YncE
MTLRLFLTVRVLSLATFVLLGSATHADSLLVVNATSDPSQGNILQYDAATGTPLGGGPLVAAGSGGLNAPAGLTVGPDGNLYVSNGYDSSVLKFDGQGNFLGAFVSSGAGGLQGPTSVAFGPDGNLYVAGFSTSSVLEYSGTTGSFLQSFVPTGAGGLVNPEGMVLLRSPCP